MSLLYENLLQFTWQQGVMILVGLLLVFLAIKKEMEPTLLLPIGIGTVIVNIPNVDAIMEHGPLTTLYEAGIANELFPLLLFIGIGAMIDFGPLLANPKLMIFGAAVSSLPSVWLQCSSAQTMRLQSLSSVRLTAPQLLRFPRHLIPHIRVRSWLRHTLIWRLFPLFSPL